MRAGFLKDAQGGRFLVDVGVLVLAVLIAPLSRRAKQARHVSAASK
jgi:hypothetical protein